MMTTQTTTRRRWLLRGAAVLLAAAFVLTLPAAASAQHRGRMRPAPRVFVSPGFVYNGWYGPGGWYGPPYPYGFAYGPRYADSGVRLKLRPRDASVYVDGYYAGIVDDFDGVFQHLELEPGGHRIEIRMPGYETASVDLHIQPGRVMTYEMDLVPER